MSIESPRKIIDELKLHPETIQFAETASLLIDGQVYSKVFESLLDDYFKWFCARPSAFTLSQSTRIQYLYEFFFDNSNKQLNLAAYAIRKIGERLGNQEKRITELMKTFADYLEVAPINSQREQLSKLNNILDEIRGLRVADLNIGQTKYFFYLDDTIREKRDSDRLYRCAENRRA